MGDVAQAAIWEKQQKGTVHRHLILNPETKGWAPWTLQQGQMFLKIGNMLFEGTLHFEACLASLLPFFTKHLLSEDKYKEMNILSDLQVEYPHFDLFLSSDSHLFSCLLGLQASYWSIKMLLPMLCITSQDLNVKPWRKFCIEIKPTWYLMCLMRLPSGDEKKQQEFNQKLRG